VGKKKSDNPKKEEKKPENMNASELEDYISTQSKVVELNPDGTRVEKEPKEPEKKEEASKEKQEVISPVEEEVWYKDFSPEFQELAKKKGWKSMEDSIKSYQEAEKKISLQGEESSKSKKQVEAYKQTLSQIYDLDEAGNIVGIKQSVQQPQQTPDQQDQLAGIRPYFPDWTDEQIMANIGLIGLMVNSALKNYDSGLEKKLEPLHEIKFEREVEKQKKLVRDKYEDDYKTFEGEINDKLSKLPPQLRAKEGSVETILLTIRGEHTPELLQQATKNAQTEVKNIEAKKGDTFVEGTGKSSVPTPPPDIGKMSSAELEEYIKKHPNYGKK